MSGKVLPLGRSKMVIDGLGPKDHEVVCGGSLHKGVNARRKKALHLSTDRKHFNFETVIPASYKIIAPGDMGTSLFLVDATRYE
jgi:hypothetical protein